MHALWNLLPAIMAGHFDDTMTGGIPGLVEQITTAVFFLITHLRIDAQFMKFERGTTAVLASGVLSTASAKVGNQSLKRKRASQR